jgi:hypothetical protein
MLNSKDQEIEELKERLEQQSGIIGDLSAELQLRSSLP